MKRNLLFLFLLMTLCHSNYGQENGNHWDVNDNQWSMTMSIIAVVNVDGVELMTSDIEIACFNGDELRSDGVRLKYEGDFNRYIAYLYPRGDEPYTLTFKLYDHSAEEELDYECMTTIQYTINGTFGEVHAPYAINFKVPVTFTGDGSWNDASNWNNSTLPTETDAVVIDGNVLVSDEVTVNSLSINEGKSVTIQDGGMLIVTGEIVNTDYDALIIEDGGQIIQRNENVAATFKKNIVNPSSWSNPVSGWQFISSPVTNAATSDFVSSEGDYDLYKFDGSQELQWVNYKNHDDFEETFTPGIGYIASYQSQDVAAFKGILNIPEIEDDEEFFEFELNYDDENDWVNFNLLGNPFSFDIVWEDNIDCNKIAEDGFITLNSATGGYVYNVEGVIKSGEGFMVYAETKRVSLEYYKTPAKSRRDNSDYINIIASNKNASDNVILRFGDSESDGLLKLDNINPNIADVYVRNNGKRYGIFSYNPDVTEIPLYFDAKEMGTYTLTFDIKGDYENLYLLDKMTGEKVNILLENEYSFIANSNDYTERFIIKMDNGQQTTDNSHFAYVSGENLIITDISGEAQINIYDALGRCVLRMDAASHVRTGVAGRDAACHVLVDGFDSGMYIIQKIDENGVNVQKLIL